MTDTNTEPTVIAKWDPVLTKHVVDVMRPIVKRYFRSEVRGLENIPARGCLVVANHSGGMMTPDWPVFAVDYYDKFGYDRPLYALAHDLLFTGPADGLLKALGIIRANPANAAQALAADGVVLVFPGGDFDVYRPTMRENVIGFAGRTFFSAHDSCLHRRRVAGAETFRVGSCGIRTGSPEGSPGAPRRTSPR